VPSQFSRNPERQPVRLPRRCPARRRRARAVEMRRVLPETVLAEIGRLDPAAIATVRDDAWPDIRDAEELHDALLSLIALPVPATDVVQSTNSLQTKLQESAPQWTPHFEQIAAERRAACADATAHPTGSLRSAPMPSVKFSRLRPSTSHSQSCPRPKRREKTRSSQWSPAGRPQWSCLRKRS